MANKIYCYAIAVALLAYPLTLLAASNTEIELMHEQIQQLEQRLQQAEAASKQTATVAAAQSTGRQSSHADSSANAFNPAMLLILSGIYGQLAQAEAPPTGFAMSPNDTGYARSFSLQESELSIAANIDPQFRGVATFALAPAGGISVENGYVQTTALGNGYNLKFGRYFSGLGYLNEQHSHTWDFVDQPLVYRVLWDNQLTEDGVQFKWLAPTDRFIELGAELGRGLGYPGSDRQKNGVGSGVVFAHIGDDIGTGGSWRSGFSLHQTRREKAQSHGVPDLAGTPGGVDTEFSGDSKTAGLDFVYKYAPDGNTTLTNLKLQGEYFRRSENGLLTYDTASANITDSYSSTQSGWYVQSVYQFMPRWRIGLRYDQLNPGNAQIGPANAANVIGSFAYEPSRTTAMMDFNPSEFSRLRLQLAQDRSRQGFTDKQIFLQYVMSLGAHGAHQF
ncbi:MAG: hypothetical protein V4443_11820 [Pseudomonadota bacterium]